MYFGEGYLHPTQPKLAQPKLFTLYCLHPFKTSGGCIPHHQNYAILDELTKDFCHDTAVLPLLKCLKVMRKVHVGHFGTTDWSIVATNSQMGSGVNNFVVLVATGTLVEADETFVHRDIRPALAAQRRELSAPHTFTATMVSEALGFNESRSRSDDDRTLVEFCHRLGSTSGTVSNDDQMRRGAELLMMLSFIPNDEIIEPLPPCASDSSFSSASSRDSSRSFGFSCPSLSLEHPAVSHDFGDSPTKATVPITTNLYPATLLERTLKVDDRDASRLSADAMARNILQSFQKAMDWRVGAWMKSLSASLLESTQDQTTFGGSLDVKSLLQTPQGTVLLALRNIQEENNIKVLQTSTTFEVALNTLTPGTKERETDEYEVTKPIKLCSQVYLSTPLGYSEIEISTPGHVKGCFSEGELSAVQIDLDTEILAAMMEKGCRKIVRTCVERAVKELESQRVPEEQAVVEESSPNTTEVPFTMSTPLQDQGALVTPQTTSTKASTFVATKDTNSKILLPDQLDLNQHAPLRRRITPQTLNTRDLISPPPPPTRTFEYSSPDDETTTNSATTPARKRARRAPLVSPTAGDTVYHEIGQDGPSLPTLVEVACRARTADC